MKLLTPIQFIALDAAHDRSIFNSGSEPLDRYVKQQVTQDIRRKVANCFVALTDENRIAGYYTLSAMSFLLADLPQDQAKKLPRYPVVPAVRMGRLAVDQDFKGQGLGGALLADALARCLRSDIAAYALVVDAKDQQAVSFYQHHGLLAFADKPMTLFLPLATARFLVK
jgi:ribosomal protein S18 acetylase RimI-like enzyme